MLHRGRAPEVKPLTPGHARAYPGYAFTSNFPVSIRKRTAERQSHNGFRTE